MTLRELEPLLATLTPEENASLVQRFALEITHAWLGVERTPGVCGGAAGIVRTRLPVWTLENYCRLGWSETQLLQNYPTLHALDLVHAWAYAAAHPTKMDQASAANENA